MHDIRSAHNVGSMFRTADGAGVSRVILTGYTPAPVDRFKREQKEITKTALGAEKTMPWVQQEIGEAIETLKKDGFTVFALEQAENAIDYHGVAGGVQKAALIVGNEVDGVPQDVLAQCDIAIEIPMHGVKESLNVSVAAGIALYELCRG